MGGLRVEDEGRKGAWQSVKMYIEGKRQVGRPGGRWVDAVDKDAKIMLKCKNWKISEECRDAWWRRTEEAKAQVGL